MAVSRWLARVSIEKKVMVCAALVFAIVGGFLSNTTHHNASRAADEAFDRVLSGAALAIADTVAYDNGSVTVDIPYAAFAILGTSRMNRVFYRVVSPGGQVVTGSPLLGLDIKTPETPEIRLSDGMMNGERIRIAAVARYRSDATTGDAGWIDILVAETREAREHLKSQLLLESLIPAITIALVAFFLIWWGIRFAFRPLRAVARSLRMRSQSDLSPISRDVPPEISTLVVALNDFIHQLDSTLNGLRRVTADAAHQLRTPLAALRAQAEITIDEQDQKEIKRRVERIHFNAVQASHLANQWLTDATLLHKLKSRHKEVGDLRSYATEAINRLASHGLYANELMQLSFHPPHYALVVHANPMGIIEMVRNLIENAFVHAPGPVEVKLFKDHNFAVLRVVDHGPGIPLHRRAVVFERFVRDSSDPRSSGLGLSIVREVVNAADGSIRLLEVFGGGTLVEVRLPLICSKNYLEPREISEEPNKKWFKSLFLLALLLSLIGKVVVMPEVKASELPFVVYSTLPERQLEPLSEFIKAGFPDINIEYQQVRPYQVDVAVRAQTMQVPDLVIFPSPEIAVALSNNGHIKPLNKRTFSEIEVDDWREELFVIGYDPAVFVHSQTLTDSLPKTRLELARMMEMPANPLSGKVGIINVGVDSVAYTLATQDSLRSSLYWRLASAFGLSGARIYDNSAELLQALEGGEIKFGYNVPLSSVRASNIADERLVELYPQDYVIAVPWTAFIPEKSSHPLAATILRHVMSDLGRAAFYNGLFGQMTISNDYINYQSISLGPELLVFLDSIKRSRFLDDWFQMVVEE
ncbi:sensor histidine kinase N-terminal domain-containing protein [Halomonas sp. 86]|uniref:sensor histidine kinase N-terminal domain-containing protein n=1 Tax=unclassified Halomonas TaxID=2609666 RepID=UPI0040342ACA